MGQTLSLRAWARKFKVKEARLRKLMRRGLTLQEALFEPLNIGGALRIETTAGIMTAKQIARIAGVQPATITTRLQRNWDGGRVAAPNQRIRLITVDGRTQSVTDWAHEQGMTRGGICLRMANGWSEEAAARTPRMARGAKRVALRFTAYGRTQTIIEWSKESGINPCTLRNRLLKSGPGYDTISHASANFDCLFGGIVASQYQ